MILGDKLKSLRIANKLTQKEVAERIWVSKSVISGYELSTRLPSYANLVKLAALYGVTTDYLLGAKDSRTLDVSGLSEEQIGLLSALIAELRKTNG